MSLRATARELFLEAIRGLDIEKATQQAVRLTADAIVCGEQSYWLGGLRRIALVAVGKAAVPMTQALLSRLAPALSEGLHLEGIVVSPMRPEKPDARLRFFSGDHPIPGTSARLAANAVLDLLRPCDETSLVFFLISGGASAMMEQPLDKRFSLEETAAFHRALVHSGLPITSMNVLRKHFSAVKGGRLAVAAQGAMQCTLLLSDVPGDALDVVGSGPSLPDASTLEECRQILALCGASLALPEAVRVFFENTVEETPKRDHPAFRRSQHLALLSSDDLCALAKGAAERRGFYVEVDNRCDDWDYRDSARYLLSRVAELRTSHERVCLLSAGEVSVQLPARHGRGGRNQQFALECARLLGERNLRATVLSGGSDGADGNSTAAGAVCDETTMSRAAAAGVDATMALAQFDSSSVFAALGDDVVTGPTGMNVRDLRLVLSGE